MKKHNMVRCTVVIGKLSSRMDVSTAGNLMGSRGVLDTFAPSIL